MSIKPQSTVTSPLRPHMERPPFFVGIRAGHEIRQKERSHYGIEFGALIEGCGTYRIGNREYPCEAVTATFSTPICHTCWFPIPAHPF
ncbi:MAG: hypothetical protein GF398_20020 [Chitinivibrionales bacterium]|nr:hypothetical protein [Chitinivibrionales bacterium]